MIIYYFTIVQGKNSEVNTEWMTVYLFDVLGVKFTPKGSILILKLEISVNDD